MIINNLLKTFQNNRAAEVLSLPEFIEAMGVTSSSGQTVSAESSKNISTAYRCINILSDDFAKMPLQTFISRDPGKIERMRPSSLAQNLAWLLELSPNRSMTPFVFKKTLMQWLLSYGNAYAWMPATSPGSRREIFVLNSAATYPVYDRGGNLWYQTTFTSGETVYLPDVEVLHLLINAVDGINGRSIITYARESIGRQQAAYVTQGKFYAQGLNPAGILTVAGEASKEARDKIRQAYQEAMGGTANAYRLAVMDSKVTKFDPITMKPVDAQFLESIQQNDLEIANYFGMPLFKLNMGKQAYNSNEQANLDYLQTTLDPYLVQTEQAAALRWLSEIEQNYTYFRFNRDVLLRTDASTRAAYLEKKIFSGQLTPNEARQIEDMSAYDGGDYHYTPANMTAIELLGG
jgi:HK97 family phage portal protein